MGVGVPDRPDVLRGTSVCSYFYGTTKHDSGGFCVVSSTRENRTIQDVSWVTLLGRTCSWTIPVVTFS